MQRAAVRDLGNQGQRILHWEFNSTYLSVVILSGAKDLMHFSMLGVYMIQ
jgi:hypothetical protein